MQIKVALYFLNDLNVCVNTHSIPFLLAGIVFNQKCIDVSYTYRNIKVRFFQKTKALFDSIIRIVSIDSLVKNQKKKKISRIQNATSLPHYNLFIFIKLTIYRKQIYTTFSGSCILTIQFIYFGFACSITRIFMIALPTSPPIYPTTTHT